MTGFTVQRSGYVNVPELYYSVITDLLANGFTLVFPTGQLSVPVAGTDYTPFHATLEATSAVDPLFAQQPWRIMFDCTGQFSGQTGSVPHVGDIFVATSLQLPSSGVVSPLDTPDGSSTAHPFPAGMINGLGLVTSTTSVDNPAMSFITRYFRMTKTQQNGTTSAGSYPMTYRLAVSSNGITLFVWEDASDNVGNQFSWISIQRPVDHATGKPVLTGHAPLFCVFGVNSDVYKFVVREDDILKPTVPMDATVNLPDSQAILNASPQVAITESNQYVITFPNGLNTQRYMYTSELDMIAYTSADVVSGFTDVPLTVYGETTARSYKAMSANGPNNTGMRILMLSTGGPMA